MKLGLSLGLTNGAGTSPFAAFAFANDYQGNDGWIDGTRYDPLSSLPGYSFTRTGEQGAIDSTGAVSYFAANVPAINDRGLHYYPTLTNAATNSQDFSAAAWTKENVTVTTNAVVAPDGTTTGDTLTDNSTNGQHRVYQSHTTSSSNTYSVIAKAGTASFITLGGAAINNPVFDLSNGTVALNNGSTGTPYIYPLANGWYRCVVVCTAASSSFCVFKMGTTATNAQSNISYVGSGSTIHIWQANPYVGASLPDGGPIIRTTGATASIGASALAFTVPNGTYDATYTFSDDTTQNNAALTIADGTLNIPADFNPTKNIIKSLVAL